MININPYIEKLELLKEYIGIKIDSWGKIVTMNYDFISSLRPEDIIELYYQTGIIMYRGDAQPEVKTFSFIEWLENRHHKAFKSK